MFQIETLLCLCMIVLTCSQNPPANLLTSEDQGKLYRCQILQEFVVELQANPSTGYSWQFAGGDQSLVRLMYEEYMPGEERELVGAPGKQLFYFQAIAPGRTPLRLEYRRSWEKEAAPAKTFSITLVIRK
jgi:inhibitor of cysteine peptidase